MSDQTESNPAALRRVIESTVVHVALSLRRLRFPGNNPAIPSLVIHGYRPAALLSNERQQEWASRSDVAYAIIRSDFA